jgi:hypothetical protein
MRPTIEVNQRDALNFNEKLAMLALPRRKRTWILKTLGRWERQNTRQRIRQQKGIDGQALEQRKNGRKKVMRRMAKGLEPYVRHNATELDLTWKNKLTAQIAARHYLGQAQRVTARQMEKRFGKAGLQRPRIARHGSQAARGGLHGKHKIRPRTQKAHAQVDSSKPKPRPMRAVNSTAKQ